MEKDEEIRFGAGFTQTNYVTQEVQDQSLSLVRSFTIYDAEFWARYRSSISSLRSQWTTSAVFTDSKSIVQTFWAIQNGREPYYEKILHNLNTRLERERRSLPII